MREVYKHWLPRLLKVDGVTIGSTIYYYRSDYGVTEKLRRHEQTHVKQYKELGICRFLFIYLLEYIWGRLKGYSHLEAYHQISFELEAQRAERQTDGD